VIHFDLKPQNILVNLDFIGIINDVRICDFGLSGTTEQEMKGGRDSRGTIHYMAPEMLFHDVKFDKRIDAWALGVILYRLITGNLPFVGAT